MSCSASWFFGCVFSYAGSDFASGCLICSALPWVLNCLGWAFTPGVIRLRFGCLGNHLGNAISNHYLLFTSPVVLYLFYGKRGLGNRPGREVGDSVFASRRKTPFRETL